MPEPTGLTPERLDEIRADLDRRVPAVDIADRDIARELLAEVNRLRAGVAAYRSVGLANLDDDPGDDPANGPLVERVLHVSGYRGDIEDCGRVVEVFVRVPQPDPTEDRAGLISHPYVPAPNPGPALDECQYVTAFDHICGALRSEHDPDA